MNDNEIYIKCIFKKKKKDLYKVTGHSEIYMTDNGVLTSVKCDATLSTEEACHMAIQFLPSTRDFIMSRGKHCPNPQINMVVLKNTNNSL